MQGQIPYIKGQAHTYKDMYHIYKHMYKDIYHTFKDMCTYKQESWVWFLPVQLEVISLILCNSFLY